MLPCICPRKMNVVHSQIDGRVDAQTWLRRGSGPHVMRRRSTDETPSRWVSVTFCNVQATGQVRYRDSHWELHVDHMLVEAREIHCDNDRTSRTSAVRERELRARGVLSEMIHNPTRKRRPRPRARIETLTTNPIRRKHAPSQLTAGCGTDGGSGC